MKARSRNAVLGHLVVVPMLLLLVASCDDTSGPSTENSADCAAGSIGCACASGGACGATATGESLRCVDSVCIPTSCESGATGCVCRGGTRCDATTDACTAGVCKPAGCLAGSLTCDCLLGTCEAGLYCDSGFGDGTCVDDAGFPGGECPANGLCRDQSRCDRSTATCVHCELGSQGCAPDHGRCNAGLLYAAGRCLPRNEIPPGAPSCYTPCSGDVPGSNGLRRCDSEGFLEGCLDGLACVAGSCVAPGDSAVICADDTDCPGHQACLSDHRCYSNCATGAECPVGLSCHGHVCRMPCDATSVGDRACPTGQRCDMADGREGYCVAQVAPPSPSEEAPDVDATYSVDPPSVSLAARTRSAEARILNSSPRAETFVVRKAWHRVFDRRGAQIVDARGRTEPLWFVSLSSAGSTRRPGGGLEITAPARCGTNCPTIAIANTEAIPATWSRFEGDIAVAHPTMGEQTIHLSYQASVDGRWTGTMYYFAAFPSVGLDQWRDGDRSKATYSDEGTTYEVGNGLIAKWVSYRTGRLDTFAHLRAVLDATSNGSWDWPSVRSARPSCSGGGACYLYDTGLPGPGVLQYVVNSAATPIPSGVTQYPIALNLRVGPTDAGGRYTLTGTIDSSVALHYGGRPRVDLAFLSRPDDVSSARCEADSVPGDCVALLADFRADVLVGARTASTPSCTGDLAAVEAPWLVPGFDEGTSGGTRRECRETAVPYASGDPRNANLTIGNPIADGHSLARRLRMLDGAMIDQRHLFVLFEESVTSSLRTEPLRSFGYILLERSEQPVTDVEIASSTVGTSNRPVQVVEPHGSASCDPAIRFARSHLTGGAAIPNTMTDLARANLVLTGRVASPTTLANVHYLCVDNGLFDGGPGERDAASDVLVPCPEASRVVFFGLPVGYTQAYLADLPCQRDGTCGVQLQSWLASNLSIVKEPPWTCTDGTSTCAADRFDRRLGKVFYAPGAYVFPPLETAVDEAFRYKARFRTSQDRSVGFVPVPCVGTGELTPYCYDAQAIEETAARVECLLRVYADNVASHDDPAWTPTRTFLSGALGVRPTAGATGLRDGFERLHAELLIMLGDDAMTHALGSRFDAAATSGGSFPGSRFELSGIEVGGIAGYEMRELHLAAQYYEMATDRFFTRVAPVIFAAIEADDVGPSHVASPDMVESYLERLIGGSTKKAAAWSRIAERYRGFNRADLARSVLERAYMGTYLESMFLARLMLDLAEQTDNQHKDSIVTLLERAQTQYGAALARMSEVYGSITRDGERFGFSPDYIPFPAVDDSDTRYANAFEAVLGLARLRADTARRFEDDAVLSRRGFETDAASFESELVQIGVDKERRLSQICGTFVGRDSRVHPAIERYASLSDRTAILGNPCGFVGNGELHEKNAELALLDSDIGEYRRRIGAQNARIVAQNARVSAQCARIGDLRDLQIGRMEERRTIQAEISRMENAISFAERATQHVAQEMQMTQCSLFDCVGLPFRVNAYTYAAAISELAIIGLEEGIIHDQGRIATSQIDDLRDQVASDCQALHIDVVPTIADIEEEILQLGHDVDQTNLKLRTGLDALSGLRLEARRYVQEQEDAERMAIDVAASRSDPNVRVYMNTAMSNAERSFDRALEHAFRATRLLEYFKSESYAHADELYLIRMVSRGDYNLDTYLDALEDDYEAFRVQYRTRSSRAVRLSLANDILRIPYVDALGRPIPSETRTEMLRAQLLDPTRLDANGRRTFEFHTSLDQFAPCTFGHQINYVEVMLSGSSLGDANASVMLWQDGTGVIRRADGDRNFHRLPPALIVATPRRDLDSSFDPSVYRNYGMRERPLVNTSWRFVFDEFHPQNRDIRFDRLNDVYFYIYYTDFTNPDACR